MSQSYQISKKYWQHQPATVNGVLGGFGFLNSFDIASSKQFLLKNFQSSPPFRVLDCGCGIGRISQNLLTDYFDEIDLVEQNDEYLEIAKRVPKVSHSYLVGLQDFHELSIKRTYNVIWIQWVTIYLMDDDFVTFLKKCKEILVDDGIVIVKENISSDSEIVNMEEEDSSVMRTDKLLKDIFSKGGFDVICEEEDVQLKKVASGIYPVKMYALKKAY